jgi:hypothetical protein
MKSVFAPLTFFTVLFMCAVHHDALGQGGVSISQGVAVPDPSAQLDVSATDRGILIPRMTEAQRLLISSPAEGLLVYQTDGAEGFWYFNGALWMQGIGPAGPAGAPGPQGPGMSRFIGEV